jgi:ADP-ribosylglycohydrolase
MEWANSGINSMGRNTRELFKGITTYKGYTKRYSSKFGEDSDENDWTQSNGCLMRCSPLSLLPRDTYLLAVEADCKLTNPHPICIESNTVYSVVLKNLLEGKCKSESVAIALNHCYSSIVKSVITDGMAQKYRNIEENKGWILHALYCCFYFLSEKNKHTTYEDTIDEIIKFGGDCDTTACIAGALIGAYFGYKHINLEDRTKQNIQALLSCDTQTGEMKRTDEYSAKDLANISRNMYKTFK